MKFKAKSYKILWWSSPITTLLLLGQSDAFDLQMHDTYLVIGSLHIAVIFALILGLTGSIYWMLRDYKLIVALNLTHSIITSAAVIGISLVAVFQTNYRTKGLEGFSQLNSIGVILILTLVIIQLVFLINILIGLIRGKKGKQVD